MNAEKYTKKTIETINTAQAMAQENGNQYLTAEHLLYALVDQDGGLIGSLLKKMGADSDAILAELDTEIRKLPRVSGGSGDVYASPELNKILRFAEKAAEYCDVADRLARHRDNAHGCGLAVDHADGGFVGNHGRDGFGRRIARNSDHVKPHRAHAGHGFEFFHRQSAGAGSGFNGTVFTYRNEGTRQAADVA